MKNFLRKLFYINIERELRGCYRILDLGCGKSSILERLHGNYYSVGVDGYPPYIEESKMKGIHDEYILSDIMKVEFPDKSFDAIICAQVIEHLVPEDAAVLMKRMERWATKKIIMTTPNCESGFSPTEHGHVHEGGGDPILMNHKSGWTVETFRKFGYRVRGYDGFEQFFGKPGFARLLYYISLPPSYFLPRYAYQLLAIKDL